jgi:mono/diheme cytochrome c family protein
MRAAALGAAFLLTTAVATAQHETAPPQGPALVPQSLIGSTSFDLYCASCHGRDATGNGPTAASLRIRPADLTTLARRHNGRFPREEVRAFIDGKGRALPAHGSSEMPVWGPLLRALDPSDARVNVRLDNLVAFIESMQKPADSADKARATRADGASLFQSYCAACHGANARGDGPMVAALRRQPADLTKFATRNGGVFPDSRVTRIIDGRDVAAHGDSEMPVWGSVFKREGQGVDEATARARIEALVQFLASIQERPAE